MENQPGGWFSPLLPFVQCLRFGCRTPGDAHGIRSHGTDSPIPTPTAHPPFVRPHSGQRSWNPFPWNGFPYPHPDCAPSIYQTALWARYKGKDRPEGRSFHERPLAAGISLAAASDYFFILVDFPSRGIGKIKGDFAVCGRRPACAAGSRRVADPDPLVACGRELVRTFPLLTSWEPEPQYHPYTAGVPSG